MIAELGAFSLILALVLSLAQTALAAAGRITGSESLRRAAEGAAAAVAGAAHGTISMPASAGRRTRQTSWEHFLRWRGELERKA